MARVTQFVIFAFAAALLLQPVGVFAADKDSADAKKATKKPARVMRDKKGRKLLKFNALEIEGEHETPNVIIIQEWAPPRDADIQDEATDDLDKVFTGIRSLNRQFEKELQGAPDVEDIAKEAERRKEEQRLLEAEQPKKKERARKTSLR